MVCQIHTKSAKDLKAQGACDPKWCAYAQGSIGPVAHLPHWGEDQQFMDRTPPEAACLGSIQGESTWTFPSLRRRLRAPRKRVIPISVLTNENTSI